MVSKKRVWGDCTSLICQDGTEAKRETILENQYRSLRDATKSGSRDILHPPPARPVGFVFMVEVANSRSDWRMKSSRTDPSGAQIGGGAPGTRTPRRCRLIGQRATTSNCQRAQSRRREGVGRDLHWVTAQLERVCVNLSICRNRCDRSRRRVWLCRRLVCRVSRFHLTGCNRLWDSGNSLVRVNAFQT